MVNPTGNIVLNGITDRELAKIWEFKARNEKSFLFAPGQMQSINAPQGEPYYNNIHFTFSSEAGLSIVQEVVTFLLKKEEKAATAQ